MDINLSSIISQLNSPTPDAVALYIAEQGGVPEENAGGIPAGITVMETLIDPVAYEIVWDSESESVRKGIVSTVNDAPFVTFFLPEGWNIVEVNHKLLHEYIENGLTDFSIGGKLTKLGYDPLTQRTCKWYTAGRDQKEEYGTEDSSEYEFDKPHGYGICSQKSVKVRAQQDNPRCVHEQAMAHCGYYEVEPMVNERKWQGDNVNGVTVTIRMMRTRRGPGVPEYHIQGEAGSEKVTSVMEQPLENYISEAMTHYEVSIFDEVVPEVTTVEKDRYFDYVLSS